MPVQVLGSFHYLIKPEKVGSQVDLCSVSLSATSTKQADGSFSKLLASCSSLHLILAVLFTHYARLEPPWSRCTRGGSNFKPRSLCSWRALPSPPARAASKTLATERIVPLLGCDCAQTHTCERLTFYLNINLATEIFHSY